MKIQKNTFLFVYYTFIINVYKLIAAIDPAWFVTCLCVVSGSQN